jgi:plasmid stabilization system protein ParE
MAFEIEYTTEAENDLDGILTWLLQERQAGETGLRWYQGLRDKISTLSELPQRCGRAPESKSLPFEMRQLLYGRKPRVYRVLFTVEGNTVHIIAVRRPYQDAVSLH